jgi:hypothetical protein
MRTPFPDLCPHNSSRYLLHEFLDRARPEYRPLIADTDGHRSFVSERTGSVGVEAALRLFHPDERTLIAAVGRPVWCH